MVTSPELDILAAWLQKKTNILKILLTTITQMKTSLFHHKKPN